MHHASIFFYFDPLLIKELENTLDLVWRKQLAWSENTFYFLTMVAVYAKPSPMWEDLVDLCLYLFICHTAYVQYYLAKSRFINKWLPHIGIKAWGTLPAIKACDLIGHSYSTAEMPKITWVFFLFSVAKVTRDSIVCQLVRL